MKYLVYLSLITCINPLTANSQSSNKISGSVFSLSITEKLHSYLTAAKKWIPGCAEWFDQY
jgi:hypothetical protein